MLVTLMARMQAISQMHTAQYNMMRNNMAMMGVMRSLPSFGGNMAALNAMDTQFALNNAQNQMLYQMACAQEKALAQRMAQEAKEHKISYSA